MITVRFAPSPTGFLHIGGARTALFNYLYARAQNGRFLLRVEDTDLNRSKKEYEEEILDSMRWLGMDWDELFYQSQRFEIYRERAGQLLNKGLAYKEGEAVLLKMPPDEQIKIFDLIRGEIQFESSELKDQVLLKSDGSPAYSFCCVVDDALMGVTHVIRGEDHISNTPKQVMIYKALDFKIPKYAHLPLILGEDGSRMSKRTGAVAVSDYRKQGYLKEAVENYLMLLGWSPGNNQEIFTVPQAIKKFSIKKVNKAAAVFSMDKLKWVNNQYIRELSSEDFIQRVKPFFDEKGWSCDDIKSLTGLFELYKGRLTTLRDFVEWTSYYFEDDLKIDDKLREELITEEASGVLAELAGSLEKLEDFTAEFIEKRYREVVEKACGDPKKFLQPLRLSVTGQTVGPALFVIIEILGRERVSRRLNQAARDGE